MLRSTIIGVWNTPPRYDQNVMELLNGKKRQSFASVTCRRMQSRLYLTYSLPKPKQKTPYTVAEIVWFCFVTQIENQLLFVLIWGPWIFLIF